MRHYASEATAFEVIGQLSCEGRDAYEKHWRCCMEMCEDAFFEPGKRKMSVSENLAVVHGLIHCGTINAERQQSSGQMRFTLVGQKRKGDWQIIHDHWSLPFNPQSMRVLAQRSA